MVILEQFDPDHSAIINPPQPYSPEYRLPDTAVSCFTASMFRTLLHKICENKEHPAVFTMGMGTKVHIVTYKGKKLALYLSPVGAPACAAVLEDIYAMGTEKVVIFGTCGVLDRTIPDGSVIIPDSAVRDEGTSYHYMPASDEIILSRKYRDCFESLLKQSRIPYTTGKVWTTDAVYRETRAKTQQRRRQGCICVDMECSALASVARFREKELFQFFYAADNLDAESWDPRSLSSDKRIDRKTAIAILAADLAASISGTDADYLL